MGLACLFRRVLVLGIVTLLFGASWMAVLRGNVSVAAAGVTIYVDDDNVAGPWDGSLANPYQNITSGLARASDGDTVYVFSGTYYENVVVNKSVTLIGDSKPVINGTGDWRAIDIAVNNVTVSGFNITSSGYGIYTKASGFSIANNVFWYSYYQSFYWEIYEGGLAEDYTLYDCTIMNNEFYTSGSDAVGVAVFLDYNHNSGYDVAIGDVTISDNTFHMDGTSAWGINVEQFGVYDLTGGTVSVGVVNMSGNAMYGGFYGIDFYGSFTYLNNTQASIGDVIISNNVMVDQTARGMDIDYYDVENLYGNTIVTLGDLIITGNTITSAYGAYGIYVSDIGYWDGLTDYASLEVGSVYVEENEIDVAGFYGIFFYGKEVGYDLDDYSSFAMGHILVGDNTINSGGQGVYVDFKSFGSYIHGNSSFSMGNIEFSGNTINSRYEGIYVNQLRDFGYEMNNDSSFTMGNILFSGNVINSDGAGIFIFDLWYFGIYMEGTSSFIMGNIEITGNLIKSYSGIHIGALNYFGYEMYDDSFFTMGDVRVNGNVIDSNSDGIKVDSVGIFGTSMHHSSSFTMGNIEFSGNAINNTAYGIYITQFYSFGCYLDDDSSFAMGGILVNNNIITSGLMGIYVPDLAAFGNINYGTSSLMMGNIEFVGNEIVSGDDGIQVGNLRYFGNDFYDNATFTMDSILLNDNIISSGSYGILAYNMQYFGENLYGNSSVVMNNIEFRRNTVNSTVDALGFSSFGDFGTYMHANSSFSMGNILVTDNTLYSYIWLTSFGRFGAYLYENSSCTMGNAEFGRNVINSVGKAEDGITFYNLLPFGYEMYNYSSFIMGGFSVSSNTIVADGDRFGIACTQGSGGFGINVYDNASALTGNFEFAANNISFTGLAFNLWKVKNAIIRNNTVRNSTYGIFLPESFGNHIYHNNLINNTIQADVTVNYNNTWDNGYPSGGNYWSDYTGTDQYCGPDQDAPGSDFRGDTPYIINQNNTDHYPLTIPYETNPPTITILSPENRTYSVYTGIQLTFTLDELADWMGYSLDDQAVVTIAGNMTLPALTAGRHHVTVYANDTFDNMGVSTIYFTVLDTTDPIANAGSDRTVNEDVSTTLDGSASTDNVGITGYTWTFTDVTMKTLTGDKPTYTFSNPGVYTITLNVTDAAGNWATDTVVITVLDVTKPIANAGNDQTVNVGATVTFDASGSSDNVGITSYEWDFGDGTTGTGKTTTHEYTEAGTYTVTLTVKDAAGNQGTDTMVVTVNPAEAFPWWIVAAAVIVAAGIIVAVVIFWRRRKKTAG